MFCLLTFLAALQVAGASLALPLSIAIVGIATILAVASVFLVKRKRKRAAFKDEASAKTVPKSKQHSGSSKVSSPPKSASLNSGLSFKARTLLYPASQLLCHVLCLIRLSALSAPLV